MNKLVIALSFSLLLFTLHTDHASAACEPRGTTFYFGNGMFNTEEEAEQSLDHLAIEIKKTISDDSRDLEYRLAYKQSESFFIQILNVLEEKAIDNLEHMWLWHAGLEDSPDWYSKWVEIITSRNMEDRKEAFPDLLPHLDGYSDSILRGHNVILVSHSQGNLYANQVMKNLDEHGEPNLTGSISTKNKRFPLYPLFKDIFANVQIATPAAQTIGGSPYSTFRDDIVMQFVRTVSNALPGNLLKSGRNLGSDGDRLGHNFMRAYLRSNESRMKILNDIKSAYSRLRYPIRYNQTALRVE